MNSLFRLSNKETQDMHRSLSLLATFALIAIFSLPSAAQAPQPWTQVGSLVCKVDPNVGFIFVGHQ
jgi:hypothetical protein